VESLIAAVIILCSSYNFSSETFPSGNSIFILSSAYLGIISKDYGLFFVQQFLQYYASH
jgi:hypothetical protein